MDVERLVVTLTANAVQYNRVMDEVVQTVVRTASAITNVFAKTADLAVAAFKAPFQALSGIIKAPFVMMATSWAGGMQMIRGMGQIISGTVGVIQNSVDMLFNYGRAWAGVNNVLAGSRMMIQGVQMAYLGLFSAMRGGFTGLFTAGVFQFFTGLQSFFTGLRQSSAGIVGMWNNLTGGFQSFYQILQGGGNVIGGFIKGGLGALKDAFMSVASGVWAAVKGVGTAVWELGKAFMSVGFEVVTGMAKTLTAGLGGLLLVTGLVGAQTLRLAADYEKANIAFGVMTGNAEMGTKLLEDITQLGIQSPFRSTELIPIAKELKAFGIETDQIIPTLKALGNVSAGTDTPLSRIALAFGQVRVAGRLTGDELRQFVNANVPLIEYLAKVMDVPVTSIRNMVEAGRVGFNHVQMAFNAMSAEGGAFAGLMEKLNNTVGGQWSAFVERIELAMRNVGLAFFKGFEVKELLRDMSDMLTGAGGSIDRLVPHFQKLREMFDVLQVAAGAIGGSLTDSLGRMSQALTGSGINWKDTKEAAVQFVRVMIVGVGNLIDLMSKFAKVMVDKVLIPFGDAVKQMAFLTGGSGDSVYGAARAEGKDKLESILASTGAGIVEQFESKEDFAKRLRDMGVRNDIQNPFQFMKTAVDSISGTANTATDSLKRFDAGILELTKDMLFEKKMGGPEAVRYSKNVSDWMTGSGPWNIGGMSDIQKKWMQGASGGDLLRVVASLPGEVTKMIEKVRKDIETEGTTDYDKFSTNIDRLFKAEAGIPLPEGVHGPVKAAITEQELAFGVAAQFEEFSKGLSKSMTTMPTAVRFGSTEAAETINRSMVDQKSTMEEVKMAIVLGNQMAAERKKRLDEILAAVRANKGGIVVAKPPGNGK